MVSSNWPPSERVVRRPPMALERSARFANPRPPRRSGWLAASCSNPSRTGGAQTHRHVAPDPTDKPHGGSPSAGGSVSAAGQVIIGSTLRDLAVDAGDDAVESGD